MTYLTRYHLILQGSINLKEHQHILRGIDQSYGALIHLIGHQCILQGISPSYEALISLIEHQSNPL